VAATGDIQGGLWGLCGGDGRLCGDLQGGPWGCKTSVSGRQVTVGDCRGVVGQAVGQGGVPDAPLLTRANAGLGQPGTGGVSQTFNPPDLRRYPLNK
jgi:hypothetical protein